MCFFLSSKLYFKGTLSDNAENSIIYLTRPVKSLTGKGIQESDTYYLLEVFSHQLNLFHFIVSLKAKIIYISFILKDKYEVTFGVLLIECMKDIDC